MFELLTGEPPFYTDDIHRLYSNIKKGQLKFPDHVNLSDQCKDIITKLMRNNPRTRLGSKNGIDDIKNHPFFQDINW